MKLHAVIFGEMVTAFKTILIKGHKIPLKVSKTKKRVFRIKTQKHYHSFMHPSIGQFFVICLCSRVCVRLWGYNDGPNHIRTLPSCNIQTGRRDRYCSRDHMNRSKIDFLYYVASKMKTG